MSFGYEEKKIVLHGLTLHAKPGQKLAFVGSTGAGKTTITNLINRFYNVQNGKILYDGIDINKIKKPTYAAAWGSFYRASIYLPARLYSLWTTGRYGRGSDESRKVGKCRRFYPAAAEGYHTKLSGDGSELSQGQCQLLATARAAVANPPVLILDEAISSIDTQTEEIVQRGMDALMKGRTVFVIAHRLSTIRNSDAIIVLDHGRMIERGNHEELLEKKGAYYSSIPERWNCPNIAGG